MLMKIMEINLAYKIDMNFYNFNSCNFFPAG